MDINGKTIQWVAELSRLSLTHDEEIEMREKLKAILDYMDILGELDLGGVEPTAHTLGYSNVTRRDEVGESLSIEVVKRIAPHWEKGHIVVPRVV
jgi:aspartyl-tRNA(Asn)/glutamyl-tRNA(Gln) amidotransferase subunit C